ncbi:MAG: hypothetical protein LBM74_04680 [Oscillospiraceae bacterium]|jgi:hypothetical protein|nr:hypothetical protein [Oscillospiraceae bacterium]
MIDTAEAFATHLRALGLSLERGTGYWADKQYYIARHQGEAICFFLLNTGEDSTEPPGFNIWLGGAIPEPIEPEWQAIVLCHIDFCAHCGGCENPGGSRQRLFGQSFDRVCITPFRFDNPSEAEIACAVHLVETLIPSSAPQTAQSAPAKS